MDSEKSKQSKHSATFTVLLFITFFYWVADTAARTAYIDHFNGLHRAAKYYFEKGDLAQAHQIADKLLAYEQQKQNSLFVSVRFKFKHWNHGNGIHSAHTIKGLWSLKAGDLKATLSHLMSSCHVPGSPQLETHGPSMILAAAINPEEHQTALINFLDSCGEFWDNGKLKIWKNTIKQGLQPAYDKHRLELL